MKILKNCFVSFMMLFVVLFGFSACGKTKETPPTPQTPQETFETEALTYSQFEELMEQTTHEIEGGFAASIKTTYADGSTDSAEQLVLIGIDRIKSSISVSGKNNFSAYLVDRKVYYADSESKLFSYVEDYQNAATENFKTRMAYDYIVSMINPTGLSSFNIYDGSIFEDLKAAYEIFDDDESAFTIQRQYNSLHTNIIVNYKFSESLQTTYTLRYENGELYAVEVTLQNTEMTRTLVARYYDGDIELPENLDDEFLNEQTDDEVVDDNWSPDD